MYLWLGGPIVTHHKLFLIFLRRNDVYGNRKAHRCWLPAVTYQTKYDIFKILFICEE